LLHQVFVLDSTECFVVGNEELKLNDVEIFPNPSSDWVTIKAASLEKLEITNGAGQLLWSRKLSGEPTFQLEINDFSNGIYYLMINDSEVKKLIVLR